MTSDKYRSALSILHLKKSLIMYGPDSIYISYTFINNFNKNMIFLFKIEEFEMTIYDFDLNTPPYLLQEIGSWDSVFSLVICDFVK